MNASQEGEPSKPEKRYKPEAVDPTADFKYKLGKHHFKDQLNGDAGCLMKKPQLCPEITFVRAQYIAKRAA